MNRSYLKIKERIKDALAEPHLVTAARKGDSKTIERRLKKNKELVDAKDQVGNTPLIAASANNHTEVVKLLLKAGADVDCRNIWEKTALYEAIQKGNIDVLSLLLATETKNNSSTQEKALRIAASLGRTQIVKDLLKAKDRLTKTGVTNALLEAADSREHKENEYVTIVKLLVEANATVNATCNQANGETPLIQAVTEGPLETIRYLLEAKADPNLADREGRTPLLRAVLTKSSKVKKTDLIGCLLEKKAAPDLSDKYDDTPLHCAIRSQQADVAQCLFDAKATFASNSPGGTGSFLLIGAVFCNDQPTVKLLLSMQANVDYRTHYNGETALIMAVKHRQIEMTKLLLAAHAAVDIQDNAGNTALIKAAQQGDSQLIELLLAAGAAVSLRNKANNTALTVACGSADKMMLEQRMKQEQEKNDADNRAILTYFSIKDRLLPKEICFIIGVYLLMPYPREDDLTKMPPGKLVFYKSDVHKVERATYLTNETSSITPFSFLKYTPEQQFEQLLIHLPQPFIHHTAAHN